MKEFISDYFFPANSPYYERRQQERKMELTYNQKIKILKEVVLSYPTPETESEEARQWRKHCEHDVATHREQGFMTEIPWDPSDDDEEGGGVKTPPFRE